MNEGFREDLLLLTARLLVGKYPGPKGLAWISLRRRHFFFVYQLRHAMM